MINLLTDWRLNSFIISSTLMSLLVGWLSIHDYYNWVEPKTVKVKVLRFPSIAPRPRLKQNYPTKYFVAHRSCSHHAWDYHIGDLLLDGKWNYENTWHRATREQDVNRKQIQKATQVAHFRYRFPHVPIFLAFSCKAKQNDDHVASASSCASLYIERGSHATI